MARQATATTQRTNPITRAKVFFEEVRVEMSKVVWPSWEELKTQTTVVLILLVIMAATVGILNASAQVVILWILGLGEA